MKNKQAFTLIELLVVVLIIGILAAVAVPQYQVAVAKSRYSKLKVLVDSIAKSQEIYYLTNGKYADDLSQLDIDFPAGGTPSSVVNGYDYSWGSCYSQTGFYASAACSDSKIDMGYQRHYAHSQYNKNIRVCYAYNGKADSLQGKVCLGETNSTVNKSYKVGTAIVWNY